MSMRIIQSLFFFLISLIINAQTQTYLCMRPSQEIIIDGDLSDWKDVHWTNDFIDITGDPEKKPHLLTRAKMMWDDQYMYIAAEMEEPHLR